MKPTDLRNATWRECLTHLTDDMVRVHNAWLRHGPCTTRELAERSGISIFTLRPRNTDLGKLGLTKLVDSTGTEGIYAYVGAEAAEASRVWQKEADFRRTGTEVTAMPSTFTNVETVEQSLAQLQPAQQVAIAAKIMSKFGHNKKRTHGAEQMDLIPA